MNTKIKTMAHFEVKGIRKAYFSCEKKKHFHWLLTGMYQSTGDEHVILGICTLIDIDLFF